MNDKRFENKNILKILKMLGLSVSEKTGGQFHSGFENMELSKNRAGLYVLEGNGQKISFLNGVLFLSTVKMVEDSLNYKLFK